jgi:hypothetical protein
MICTDGISEQETTIWWGPIGQPRRREIKMILVIRSLVLAYEMYVRHPNLPKYKLGR